MNNPLPVLRGSVMWVLATWGAGFGCCGAHIEHAAQLTIKLEDAQAENEKLKGAIASLEADIASRQDQVAELEGTKGVRRDKVISVHHIELGSLTGGRDFDNQQGHDGLRVFVHLLDREGDKIKQAGRIRIEAFDLELGGDAIERWDLDLDKTAAHWLSTLGAYHYAVDCKWNNGLPKHPQITVRVKFTELLSGRTFTADKSVEIEFPATLAP